TGLPRGIASPVTDEYARGRRCRRPCHKSEHGCTSVTSKTPIAQSSRHALRARLRVRIEDVQSHALPRALHDAHVLAPELARVPAAARVRDHVDLAVHALRVVRDAQELLFYDETALQPVVVRGDPGRAGVQVAAQRLDAPER